MNKENIIDYVAQTPYNSNKKVLGDMLDTLMEENKGNDNIIFVNLTQEDPDSTSYFCDTKEVDVWNAVKSGKLVYAIVSDIDGIDLYRAEDAGDEVVIYTFLNIRSDTLQYRYFKKDYNTNSELDADGKSWQKVRYDYELTRKNAQSNI